jgi:hypothetical protein
VHLKGRADEGKRMQTKLLATSSLIDAAASVYCPFSRGAMTWYTPKYCEENVWNLAKLRQGIAQGFVVFISNERRSAPLWNQSMGEDSDTPVLWDYHAIYVEGDFKNGYCVFDMDSTLDFPVGFKDYFKKTFRPKTALKKEYRRFFRVVTAERYLEHFSSDRSHMRLTEHNWLAAPPQHPPIQAPDGSESNMHKWKSMVPVQPLPTLALLQSGFGCVLSLKMFYRVFVCKHDLSMVWL